MNSQISFQIKYTKIKNPELFSVISKLFDKLLLKSLKMIIEKSNKSAPTRIQNTTFHFRLNL